MACWWRLQTTGSSCLEWEWGKTRLADDRVGCWLMNREAGCQSKPVIEGGCELPPWIFNVPWQLQHSSDCLEGASRSPHLLLHAGLLYIALLAALKGKCVWTGEMMGANVKFIDILLTYIMYNWHECSWQQDNRNYFPWRIWPTTQT